MKKQILIKYKKVADEWIANGYNGKKAYLKVYPTASDATATVNANKIFSTSEISEYIDKKQLRKLKTDEKK